MQIKDIQEAVKNARSSGRKRNFKQTFDLAISLKGMDLKKDESKIKEEVLLPHGRGKPIKIGAIAEGELGEKAKKAGIEIVINKAKLATLAANKKETRKLVNNVDLLIAQPDLMVEVGKTLGPVLGPRDKMPKPVPPNVPLEPILARLNKVVNVRVRDQPVVHCSVGIEDMQDNEVADNIHAILNVLKGKLPKGNENIRAVHVKLTMGASIKIGAPAEGKPAEEPKTAEEGKESEKAEEKKEEVKEETKEEPKPKEETPEEVEK